MQASEMAPLIKARPGFGKKLVAPFDVETGPAETIYLVSRTEPARDRRMPLRRWIVDAVDRARQEQLREFTALEAAAGSNQPNNQQKYDSADRGIDDLPHDAAADGNAELWKQQTGDQRAGDTDENIADDPKAGAAHDLSGQPACNQADE
jgi:hypothetical protein